MLVTVAPTMPVVAANIVQTIFVAIASPPPQTTEQQMCYVKQSISQSSPFQSYRHEDKEGDGSVNIAFHHLKGNEEKRWQNI
ncbi:hypothetical protein ES708_18582 [subsurface metagenome]